MAGFKKLKDVSTNFAIELQHQADHLHCAKVGETADDVIVKKLQSLSVFSSKYRLLHAKETASTPQIIQRVQNGANIMAEYEDAIQRRVLEGAFVKAVSRNQAVKTLLTTPDDKMNPELVIRKHKIKERLHRLVELDTELAYHDSELREKQDQLDTLRSRWDETLGQLREKRANAVPEKLEIEPGSLHDKLTTLVGKMELMRSLLGPLATGRNSQYDWLADPDGRISMFAITREENTVSSFISQHPIN